MFRKGNTQYLSKQLKLFFKRYRIKVNFNNFLKNRSKKLEMYFTHLNLHDRFGCASVKP